MNIYKYNRFDAVKYAQKYAKTRNPAYYNFDNLGGNCTNFVSQCLYSGAKIMNYSRVLGWYFNSISDRAPAWTGVGELFNFLTKNTREGPFGKLVNRNEIEIGDVIELGRNSFDFYHSVIVSSIIDGRILVCSNTRDTLNVPLEHYSFSHVRYIHILGVRKPAD